MFDLPVALLSSLACELAPLRIVLLCAFLPIFTSLFIRVTSPMIMYDKRTLLDIGQRYTNLIQDTLSTDPAWPMEILRNTELNNNHLNNPRRRKKHRGKHAGIRNRLRKGLTVLLYRVFCSLMSNPWRIRWTILESG